MVNEGENEYLGFGITCGTTECPMLTETMEDEDDTLAAVSHAKDSYYCRPRPAQAAEPVVVKTAEPTVAREATVGTPIAVAAEPKQGAGVDTPPEAVPSEEAHEDNQTEDGPTKKKRKPKNKNKKGRVAAGGTNGEEEVEGEVEDDRKEEEEAGGAFGARFDLRQTAPEPTKPVRLCYQGTTYPKGEILLHPLDSNTYRITSAEKRAKDQLSLAALYDMRRAAEVHRQTRKWAMSWMAPGMRMIDITDRIEAKLAQLIEKDGLKAGQAFPTGCSLNHVAAHWTPNTGDATVLRYDDVCKVDFGTHVNGLVVDSAWTVAFNPVYDDLKLAVKEGTNAGLKAAGIDVRLCDVGEAIQEAIEAHELEINGKVYPIRSVRNLCGHSIEPYHIHAGKSVPIVGGSGDTTKMEEGEVFAIETFGTTGKGIVHEDLECSHYSRAFDTDPQSVRNPKHRPLFQHITQKYGTLAFCRKWLDQDGQQRHLLALKGLVDSGAVNAYPPLCDVRGSYVAQYEHTVVLRPTCKEVISRGMDY